MFLVRFHSGTCTGALALGRLHWGACTGALALGSNRGSVLREQRRVDRAVGSATGKGHCFFRSHFLGRSGCMHADSTSLRNSVRGGFVPLL